MGLRGKMWPGGNIGRKVKVDCKRYITWKNWDDCGKCGQGGNIGQKVKMECKRHIKWKEIGMRVGRKYWPKCEDGIQKIINKMKKEMRLGGSNIGQNVKECKKYIKWKKNEMRG